jgi:hypothetical protein
VQGTRDTSFALRWEYYGNGGWQDLPVEPSASGASPYCFDAAVSETRRISFNCPAGWQESVVNGTKNRWLRVRMTSGSFTDAQHMPVLSKLMLSYTYITDPDTLDHCLTRNDFQFEDHSDDARWPDRSFDPYWPVADLRPALHFGFDQPLPAGLVSLYVQVPGAEEEKPGASTVFNWEYLSSRGGWLQLGVRDESNGLRQSGMVQFIGPPDAVAAPGLGGTLYRIRARLKDGVRIEELPVGGVWLNAAWASHRVRVEQELLGTADGTPAQALSFARAPVLAGELVEIREWSGSGEGWRIVAQQVPEEDLRYERDVSDKVRAAWVRWHERPHLYDAQPQDRVFGVERATGLIRFGDGAQGMIPPAGSPIVATYTSGGGAEGDVPPGSVTQLRSAVPFVASVSNPVAALDGADGESLDAVRARGPQRLRHRDRAVAASDIEWIARDASPEVARARCLDVTGPDGHAQRGWITVIVVPRAADAQPWPTAELQRRVAEHLRERVPATVARRLRVVEPSYVPLRIAAEIVPLQPDQAALVEARVRQALERFLHPLTGGPGGSGWGFGEDVHLSNLAAEIGATVGVDYASDIRMYVGEGEVGEPVAIARDALLCSGSHEIKLVLGAR